MGSVLKMEAVLGDVSQMRMHPTEIEDVLAVAFLAMRAGGRPTPEKVATFERAVRGLLGDQGTEIHATVLMTWLGRVSETRGPEPMLAEVVSRLHGLAARQAYKLACAMSLTHFDANDREFMFEDMLRGSLGISEDEAEALMDEVIEAIETRGSDLALD
jgi:hypothetical protein